MFEQDRMSAPVVVFVLLIVVVLVLPRAVMMSTNTQRVCLSQQSARRTQRRQEDEQPAVTLRFPSARTPAGLCRRKTRPKVPVTSLSVDDAIPKGFAIGWKRLRISCIRQPDTPTSGSREHRCRNTMVVLCSLLVGSFVCRFVGLSVCRFVGLSVCRCLCCFW